MLTSFSGHPTIGFAGESTSPDEKVTDRKQAPRSAGRAAGDHPCAGAVAAGASLSGSQVLWTEGEVSGRRVLLERCRVNAVRVLGDGSSVLFYVFAAGDLFGFLPFVNGGFYPATAIAVDDVGARVMSRSTLRQAIQPDPRVAMALLGALGRRLRQALRRRVR